MPTSVSGCADHPSYRHCPLSARGRPARREGKLAAGPVCVGGGGADHAGVSPHGPLARVRFVRDGGHHAGAGHRLAEGAAGLVGGVDARIPPWRAGLPRGVPTYGSCGASGRPGGGAGVVANDGRVGSRHPAARVCGGAGRHHLGHGGGCPCGGIHRSADCGAGGGTGARAVPRGADRCGDCAARAESG